MNTIAIEDREIGRDEKVFVIAEIGVNHDGSRQRAMQLIDHARRGGADAVKIQIFRADRLMNASTVMAAYQAQRCEASSATDMLRQFELADDTTIELADAIRAAGMVPIATPFSIDDLSLIERADLPAIKIASPDLVNQPLLFAAAKMALPLMISTGAATMDEVRTSFAWLRAWSAGFALLHCVSDYPVSPGDANLAWIGELAETFDVPIGFSDHTDDLLSGALAVAAGASILEKHLTYDRYASGPDHAASADPNQFAQYVAAIRSAEVLRGRRGKRVLDCEKDVRHVSRQSVVAARDIEPGEKLSIGDVTIQRPGTGVPAAALGQVVGKHASRAIAAGTLLDWDMLGEAA